MRMNKLIIILNILLIFILWEKVMSNDEENELIYQINKSKYAEEVFKIDTTILKIPVEYDGGKIIGIYITKDSLIVLSYFFSPQVQIFDKNGKLIKNLSNMGDQPGGFNMPWFATEIQNKIVVGEHSSGKLHLFNKDGSFNRTIRLQKWMMVDGICTILDSLFVINDISAARYKKKNNVCIYNIKGEILEEFGELSDIGKKLSRLNYSPCGPMIAAKDEYIYHINYCDYHVCKYDINGKLISKFGNKPDDWKSMSKINIEKVSKNMMADVQEYLKRLHYYSMLNWISICKADVLIMELQQKKDYDNNIKRIMLYNLEGKLLHPGLIIKSCSEHYANSDVNLLPVESKGFAVLIRSGGNFKTEKGDMVNLKLLVYTMVNSKERR